MMNHRFCSVFKYGDHVYLVEEVAANGPRCMQWPLILLPDDLSVSQLGEHIRKALEAFKDLGRSIYASEWDEINKRLLNFFGAKSIATFEKKKIEITIRENVHLGTLSLFGSGKNLRDFFVEVSSVEEVAQLTFERVVHG